MSKGRLNVGQYQTTVFRQYTPNSVRGRVFDIFRRSPRGTTADDVAVRLSNDAESSISSAILTLREKKLIVGTGEYRKTRRGRRAQVWKVRH